MPYFLLVDWKHTLYLFKISCMYECACLYVHYLVWNIFGFIYIYIYIYLFLFWVLCSIFLWPYLTKRSACEFSILHQKDMARDAHCKLVMVPFMLALPWLNESEISVLRWQLPVIVHKEVGTSSIFIGFCWFGFTLVIRSGLVVCVFYHQ